MRTSPETYYLEFSPSLPSLPSCFLVFSLPSRLLSLHFFQVAPVRCSYSILRVANNSRCFNTSVRPDFFYGPLNGFVFVREIARFVSPVAAVDDVFLRTEREKEMPQIVAPVRSIYIFLFFKSHVPGIANLAAIT